MLTRETPEANQPHPASPLIARLCRISTTSASPISSPAHCNGVTRSPSQRIAGAARAASFATSRFICRPVCPIICCAATTKCAGQLAGNHITAPRPVPGTAEMRLQFETVDVFTAERFSGNPLAAVLNAEGLSSERMQNIAAEFNLAETTFVLPPKDGAHTAEVRIFTPRAEMPFAGHPNIGTAFVLARAGASYGRTIVGDHLIFEETAGLVPITLLKDGTAISGARLASPQLLAVGDEIPIEAV